MADLSAKQRRAERREERPAPARHSEIGRSFTLDGDKSPAESGDELPHSTGFAVVSSLSLVK